MHGKVIRTRPLEIPRTNDAPTAGPITSFGVSVPWRVPIVVASAVQNADEFFGCVPPLFLLLIFTFVMGIGIFSSTSLAKNLLAALSFVAFPVTTLVYGRPALGRSRPRGHLAVGATGRLTCCTLPIVRSVPSTPRNAQIWAFVAFAVPI